MRTTAIAYPLEDLVGWERSLMAFLVEKECRSSRSQGFRSTISMRCRKRKKEETQAMRAPMVTGEGSLPERPFPCAQTKTSCAVTSSGVVPRRPKKSWSMRE